MDSVESPRIKDSMSDSEVHRRRDYRSPRLEVNSRLYHNPNIKTCYFMKDGDKHPRLLKVALNPRYYNSIGSLQRELTHKMPDLSFGCRSIFSAGGSTRMASLEQFKNDGKYVCSPHRTYAKGVDLTHVDDQKSWHVGRRVPSGLHPYVASIRDENNLPLFQPRRHRAKNKHMDQEHSLYTSNAPKKCLLLQNGVPSNGHIVLLNRKTAQTFEKILDDLSLRFGFSIRKMYTIDGKRVKGLSDMLNGPDTFVVCGIEKFRKTMSPQSTPAVLPRRTAFITQPHTSLSNWQKNKRQKVAKTRGKWIVTVTTNDLPSSGTDAQVTLTVYGHKGNSGPIPLIQDHEQGFHAGQVSTFAISLGNIGDIFKVRISHDNSGEFPGWFCDEVRMKDEDTGEELIFLYGRWLSKDEDDGEICRELPVVREGVPILPVHKYEVSVVTGDLWNAATKANVYITIYGERGDTGVRHLYKPKPPETFVKGQVDKFLVEAVSLGKLKRVIIGHDGSGPGCGWFLESISIRESTRQHEQIFLCNRWLDEGEDDGKIVRELKRKEDHNQEMIEEAMFEHEKWMFNAQNQIMLFSKMTQKPLRIKPDASMDASGKHDDSLGVFTVIPKRGQVRVLQSGYNKRYHLAIDSNKILGQGKGGTYCELKVRFQPDRSVLLESMKYPGQHVTVLQSGKMGDPRGAIGTPTREFYVYVKGMFREEGVIMLNTSVTQTLKIEQDNTLNATGRKNRGAHFRVHKVGESLRMFESYIFPGQYIRLKDGQIDCKGTGDQSCHWKIDKIKEHGYVTIQSAISRGIYLGMTPEGKIRPTVNTGDKNVRFYPEIVEYGLARVSPVVHPEPSPSENKPKKEKKTVPRSPSPKQDVNDDIDPHPVAPAADSPKPKEEQKPETPKRSPTPKQEVTEEKLPSESKAETTPEPAKPTEEEEKADEERPASAKSESQNGDWKVYVITGDKENAGTNAQVTLTVFGELGDSGELPLGQPDLDHFQKACTDEFEIFLDPEDIGKIEKIRVEHDGKRTEDGWYLDKIVLEDLHNKEKFEFNVNSWLDAENTDGGAAREFKAEKSKVLDGTEEKK